ncbi:MAG: UDP-N-acetylglucosamine--N-acetylmuramyl-(pentapeptide) pyrophosphoryl-undecaprenol N-acetylglucosamine transferase, partial [Kiritimatiellaeota bacterium]|nr:UDP-N-acetylglucosamine--N-acetylmuramyl-(pentapeptide) pyrophosphoryl-undecaprenol N-acetylglucosamine transferase [Kiritimatiellota bacterium]
VAARLCRVSVALHEANALPGRAVTLLARFARRVAVSFEGSERGLPAAKVVLTGLPIRVEQLQGAREKILARGAAGPSKFFTVFVTGGSQGAHRVNELASEAFAFMRRNGAGNLRVIHQAGRADAKAVDEFYARNGVAAQVEAFVRDMGAAYAEADAVVARAGAATCAELAFCGVPAVFIPLPTATRDHQTANAQSFATAGAAVCLRQSETTPETLAALLMELRNDPGRLAAMRGKAQSLATPGAGEHLADVVERLA